MTATKTLYFATADEYLCALWIHNDWWQSGDAKNEPYVIGGVMVGES